MSDEVMSRIAAWCGDEPGMGFTEGDPPTIDFEGVVMSLEGGGGRIVLTHRSAGGDRRAGAEAVAGYPMVRFTQDDQGIAITHPLYTDGLTAQTFMQAVYAVSAGASALGVPAAAEPAPAEPAAAEPAAAEPAATEPAAAEPAAAAAVTPAAAAEDRTKEMAAAEQPRPSAWTATHRILPGMKVWPEPNP